MKKILTRLFAASSTIMIAMAISAGAQSVRITVDGSPLAAEIPPFIEDGVTYLAVRSVGDMLNADEVVWNEEEQSVVLSHNGSELKLMIGDELAYIDGEVLYTGAAPVIRGDRAFLPVRFIAETLGAKVGWESGTKTVLISFDQSEDSEFMWLSKIVNAEAGGESYEGKLAVANVVLNRVKSPDFPDTIEEVIFDKYNDIYQFTPVANGYIYTEPNAESIQAAKDALSGNNNIGECTYFCAVSGAQSSWAAKNKTFYKQIGNHCFYY